MVKAEKQKLEQFYMHWPLRRRFGFQGSVCPFNIRKAYKEGLLLKLCAQISKAIEALMMDSYMAESNVCFSCQNLPLVQQCLKMSWKLIDLVSER